MFTYDTARAKHKNLRGLGWQKRDSITKISGQIAALNYRILVYLWLFIFLPLRVVRMHALA